MSAEKITQAELAERFPNGEIPMWAVEILFGSPPEWTVGQVREKLEAEFRSREGRMKEPGQMAWEACFDHIGSRPWPWQEVPRREREMWAAVESAICADERERCAKVADPKTPRPCDCDRCYCTSRRDAQAVKAWDADAAIAAAIRALGV